MKNGTRRPRQRVELGEHIVADPKICHGKPTFKGTRIFVADVLAFFEQVRHEPALRIGILKLSL